MFEILTTPSLHSDRKHYLTLPVNVTMLNEWLQYEVTVCELKLRDHKAKQGRIFSLTFLDLCNNPALITCQ